MELQLCCIPEPLSFGCRVSKNLQLHIRVLVLVGEELVLGVLGELGAPKSPGHKGATLLRTHCTKALAGLGALVICNKEETNLFVCLHTLLSFGFLFVCLFLKYVFICLLLFEPKQHQTEKIAGFCQGFDRKVELGLNWEDMFVFTQNLYLARINKLSGNSFVVNLLLHNLSTGGGNLLIFKSHIRLLFQTLNNRRMIKST